MNSLISSFLFLVSGAENVFLFSSDFSSGLWAEHTAGKSREKSLKLNQLSFGFIPHLHVVASVVSEVRLVGGNSSCSGRLEMKDQEGWKEVKDRELTWNLMSAAEVYSVRLVDGTGLCSGRLEVKSHQLNQSWSSVSEDGFDQQDAEVVCRELDCGPPSVLQGALYGETEAPTWSTEFQCEGTEAALLDCDGSVRKYSGKAVGLTCSEPVDSIRLVGGGSRCNGRLEIKYRGEWKEVDGYYFWTLSFAGEVCKQLDCGSRVSIRRRKKDDDEEVWRLNEDCDGSSLTKCVAGITDSSRSTEVTCSGKPFCASLLNVFLNSHPMTEQLMGLREYVGRG
uniref:SRCR domain-containing protein n=1 Tax=Kryptolebias marmoratus TaxID=37003 RepID=A0A3Q3AAP6_KRYMA